MNANNKKSSRSIFQQGTTLVLVIFLLPMAGCKKDDPLTVQETIATMLISAEAWQEPTVTVDGVDYSDLYKNFTIKFDKNNYTSSGGAPMWATSGTWVFLNETGTLVKLDDVREMEMVVTADFLELSFQWEENTFEPGRISSVKGKQKFKLKKKKP